MDTRKARPNRSDAQGEAGRSTFPFAALITMALLLTSPKWIWAQACFSSAYVDFTMPSCGPDSFPVDYELGYYDPGGYLHIVDDTVQETWDCTYGLNDDYQCDVENTCTPAAAAIPPPESALLTSAQSGVIAAQMRIAQYYSRSHGKAPADYSQAFSWLQKAAAQGPVAGTAFFEAQAELGRMQLVGLGTARDPAPALAKLTNAAAQGNGTAMAYLALAYVGGWGVQQNYVTAGSWAANATNNGASGFGDAVLGTLYLEGWGVGQDYAKAQSLFEAGAKAGDSDARVKLAEMYIGGIGVTRDLARAKMMMQEVFTNPLALIAYAHIDTIGDPDTGTYNYRAAYPCLREAALEGVPAAQGLVAMMSYDGLGTKRNPDLARQWATAGYENGDWRAAWMLNKIRAAGGAAAQP